MAEARRWLLESQLDLVVTDQQIPGGSGTDLLAEIRATPALAGIPVLVVTACAMTGDRDRLLAAGFDGYLSKPIDATTFGAEIEGFFRL